MILIIAEKPSLGRNIAEGIKQLDGTVMQKNRGFLSGGNYIVTWAFGHLFSLADIEHYSPLPASTKHWTLENIPCFPEKFEFMPRDDDQGIRDQIKLISDLCNRSDVDTVVNAGDSDREGEIIIRIILSKVLKKDVRLARLWLPDQTPETVAAALRDLKSESEYDNLASEGYARTYVDWLYGVNLTRYATIKTGTLLRVGRVIVPIVRAIYERDMAIENFVPDVYLAMQSAEETQGEKIELLSKQKFNKNELKKAESECEKYNSAGAYVKSIKRKKSTVSPGKLYSLSKLQNALGKKYKMSMKEVLDIVQKLYEEGYLTYPRTNSEYLATAEKDKIKKIIANISKIGYPVCFKEGKNIFDDSKIESHSALTPTYKIPSKNSLSEDEFKVYQTVFRRFVAVFCSEDCISEKTEMTVAVGEYEDFVLKGIVILEKGWMKYDDGGKNDKILPKLSKGDKVNICFKPIEKKTSPPKHYTIETLNNYLKNPFREEKAKGPEDEDDADEYFAMFEGLELGTEATRTGIIDNARKSKYIELKNDVYTILPDGKYLVESLDTMNIQMNKFKTAELGKALKKVFKGEMRIEESVELAKNEIAEAFEQKNLPPERDIDTGFYMEIVGKCPLCGCDVKKMKFAYSCSGYKEKGCKFGIPLQICGRVISKSNARMLLDTGRSSKIAGFVSKRTGKTFDSFLKLEDGKIVFDFTSGRQNSIVNPVSDAQK